MVLLCATVWPIMCFSYCSRLYSTTQQQRTNTQLHMESTHDFYIETTHETYTWMWALNNNQKNKHAELTIRGAVQAIKAGWRTRQSTLSQGQLSWWWDDRWAASWSSRLSFLCTKMNWMPCVWLLIYVSLCLTAVCSTCKCHYVLSVYAVHRHSTQKEYSCADLVCSTQVEDQCAVWTSACAACTCSSIALCATMCWWGRLTAL